MTGRNVDPEGTEDRDTSLHCQGLRWGPLAYQGLIWGPPRLSGVEVGVLPSRSAASGPPRAAVSERGRNG